MWWPSALRFAVRSTVHFFYEIISPTQSSAQLGGYTITFISCPLKIMLSTSPDLIYSQCLHRNCLIWHQMWSVMSELFRRQNEVFQIKSPPPHHPTPAYISNHTCSEIPRCPMPCAVCVSVCDRRSWVGTGWEILCACAISGYCGAVVRGMSNADMALY